MTKTELHYGGGASDRSDPAGAAGSQVAEKSIRNAFCLCVTMIPTGIVLLYQFSGIFTGTNDKGEETDRHRLCTKKYGSIILIVFPKYYYENGIAYWCPFFLNLLFDRKVYMFFVFLMIIDRYGEKYPGNGGRAEAIFASERSRYFHYLVWCEF